MSFNVALRDIDLDGYRLSGELLEQQIIVSRLSTRPGRREARCAWQDPAPVVGLNPYWIWVTQADGEMAWSSPIFVDIRS